MIGEQMFKKLKSRVINVLKSETEKITKKELNEEDLSDILWELELALLENNVSEEACEYIMERVKNNLVGKKVSRLCIKEEVLKEFKLAIKALFNSSDLNFDLLEKIKTSEKRPFLIIFLGFNGTGKTTTMAKIANLLMKNGLSVVFAAADTFRHASIEQLEEHGKNLGVKVIKHKYGSDPAAVIFDAINYAKSKSIDVVLADTAGRTHIDKNLMEELKKIVRVNKPDMKILVVDSTSGNDVVEQARRFNEVNIDAVILTKWDVDEKGGTAISVAYAIKKPIIFLGTGQAYEDLKPFDVNEYLSEILI